MDRARRQNNKLIIVPPVDSEDSLADDTDEDPDYDPDPSKKPSNKWQLLMAGRDHSSSSSSDESTGPSDDTTGITRGSSPVPPITSFGATTNGLSTSGIVRKKKNSGKPKPLWNDVDLESSEKTIPVWDVNAEPHVLMDPIDYFRYFLDDDALQNIVDQSNTYSVQKNVNKPLGTDTKEMEQFIGTCIYMGCYGISRTRMCWGSESRIEQIADVISQNRWEEIKRFLHFNDNSKMPSVSDSNVDRLFKIRPLVDSLRNKFRGIDFDNQMLSIDEQIIPFKGRSTLKQYNPNKPHKWGYKLFVLTDNEGLVHDFEIYTGKITPLPTMPDIGASGNAVLRLIERIPKDRNHLLFFDNWYTSPSLLVELHKRDILALGTFRLYRFPGLSFKSDKDMESLGRGAFEEKESTIDGVPIRSIKWLDNKPVYITTTFDSAAPVTTIRRFDKKTKHYIDVQCPHAILTYNKFMGGVDLLDGLIAYHRIKIRSKRYYLRFFFHFIDMITVAAWRMYLRDNISQQVAKRNCLDLLGFKFQVANCLTRQSKDPKKRGRPSSAGNSPRDTTFEVKKKRGPVKGIPVRDVRRDSTGHWPSVTNERLRCRHPLCSLKSTIKCDKCNVHLCLNKNNNCFVDFHVM